MLTHEWMSFFTSKPFLLELRRRRLGPPDERVLPEVIRARQASYTGAMRRLLCALLLILAPRAALAQASVAPADARAMREVIEAQIDAFRHDDAARAFSLATPGIRETFGSAENFMEMVRKSYAVVYRPKDVVFEAPVMIEGEVVQPVRMTDQDGGAWIAVYPMQRQPDGSWRTNGCQIGRLPGLRT